MALRLDGFKIVPEAGQRIAEVAAYFRHAGFGLKELHALHDDAVGSCLRDARDVLHNVMEHLGHIRLDADDGALHSGRYRLEDGEPLLVAGRPAFEAVVLAAHHADLQHTVALRQQVEVLRVRNEAALCAHHKRVFRLRQQLEAFVAGANLLFDRLERVTHAAPVDRDVPVAPLRFVAALALDKGAQAVYAFVALDVANVVLLLCEAVPAAVRAAAIGVETHRQVAENNLAPAFAAH